MKKLRGSFAFKLITVLLLCAMAVICVLAVVGTAYLSNADAYDMGLEQAVGKALANTAGEYLTQAGAEYRAGNLKPLFLTGNFRYVILSPEGEELLSSYQGEESCWEGTERVFPRFTVEDRRSEIPVTPTPAVTPAPLPTPPEPEAGNLLHVYCYDDGQEYEFLSDAELTRWINANALTVQGYVLRDLPAHDAFSEAVSRVKLLYDYRIALPCAAGASFLLGVLLFLFLLSAAGHRDAGETITPSFIDRIPLDLFTVLIACAVIAVLGTASVVGLPGNVIGYAAGMLLLLLIGLLLLLYCMSFAVRVKLGTLWQNCLIVRLCRRCVSLLRRALGALPLLWRWALLLAGFLILEALLLSAGAGEMLWLLHALLLCPAALYLIWCMRKLRLAAKELAAGNLSHTAETRGLFGELKEHAEDLNHIRGGMNAAVEERIKSEHFKSELITNVSHDLKTPLTSLINYVDLLSREELESPQAREYVEVLSRQAAKLKKLTDDLIEASKASTGVLPVHAEACELGVLLDQCLGEYRERLEQAALEPVLQKPNAPVVIRADGRHMWRILDNLLGNAVKYGLPGTRLYLSLAAEEGQATLSFRNISREPLTLDGEALTERFVRGDDSRSSEGSGLGLAIARSLTELQGGTLTLTVDGDLFKVVLRFPLAAQDTPPAA